MINLKVKTEYDFRNSFGHIERVVENTAGDSMGIADPGTWGHIPFFKACKKHNKKALFGVEIATQKELWMENDKGRKVGSSGMTVMMTLIAKNNEGLKELYNANSEGFKNFYYRPRLSYTRIADYASSGNLIILSGVGLTDNWIKNFDPEVFFLEASMGYPGQAQSVPALAKRLGYRYVPTGDNSYVMEGDETAYEVFAGRNAQTKNTTQWIPTEWDMKLAMPFVSAEAFELTHEIADSTSVALPVAENITFPDSSPQMLREKALTGLRERGLKYEGVYKERMDYELDLIFKKNYVDYFLVIAEMIVEAKKTMLVGPSRGSSAGSLVCYLLRITEIDPIEFGLIFERFIDLNRDDLPDIDIDFPDKKRAQVITYLEDKYGRDNVAHLGTISRYKPKSAIGDAAKELGIPAWEVKDVKDAIVERSGGDARASFCIRDTFDELDVGKRFIEKYPEMEVVAEMEGHARHTGTHAAGIIVCNDPISNYCTVDSRSLTAQIDKKDAEYINMLKIDILGLRTLSVIEQCCELCGIDFHDVYDFPLDDEKTFQIFNDQKMSGIFQFEGFALFNLTKIMGVHNFNDVVALTSLARPGPLHSGSAMMYVNRRIGNEEVKYFHPKIIPFVKDTQGTIVFQEQVMEISRVIGEMTWQDISDIRRAMSKSLGDEFFGQYWEKFKVGAKKNGIDEDDAKLIWENMQTFGSWAFNKSHAVSYGLISYWCAHLKAHHPLEYAAAQLMNAKDDAQGVRLLRELVRDGYEFVPYDWETSESNWSIQDGKLVGGLCNIKGIGPKKAEDLIDRRDHQLTLTPAMSRLIENGKTAFDDIFEGDTKWKDMYENPHNYNIKSQLHYIGDIQGEGTFVFIAKITKINLRDLNEFNTQKMRGGNFKKITRNALFLNLVLEDDTDDIIATINRYKYRKFGKAMVERNAVGEWFLFKGYVRDGWRKIYIENVRPLELEKKDDNAHNN